MLTKTPAAPAAQTATHSGSVIRVLGAQLVERENGDIFLRGAIDPATLHNLKTDDYQREVLAGKRKSKIRKALEDGVLLPDIELGMRGQNVNLGGKNAILNDPVYIIDGLQRVSAVLLHLADLQAAGKSLKDASPTAMLNATIYFKTTKEWEKQRFSDLNQQRTPVAPSVMLRNMRDVHPSLLTLYGLSVNEPGFALYRRVCWTQKMAKTELITGATMVRTAMTLHRAVHDKLANTGRGSSKGGDASVLKNPPYLDRIAKEIGLSNFRENMRQFFEILDACWGVRNVQYGQLQTHLRTNFLMMLAFFISRNDVFWDAEHKRFTIDARNRQRMQTFPIYDPEVRRLGSAGTMAMQSLYNLFLMHMNKGRSKHRLV